MFLTEDKITILTGRKMKGRQIEALRNMGVLEMAVLSEEELQQITGYTTPLRQLDVLQKRGFVRAYRSRDGRIVLEKPHYLAVCW